jgi:rmuC domain protein
MGEGKGEGLLFNIFKMAIIYLLLGIIIGASIMLLWMKNKSTLEQKKAGEELAVLRSQLDTERRNVDERIAAVKENANQQLEAERKHGEQLRNELQKQAEAKNRLLQEEVRNMAAQMLDESREKMNTADKERLDALLSPLKERLEAFNQTVTNNSKENTANKTEIKTTFEEALKRLHAEQEMTIKAMREDQERAVKELREQTERIGNDAASLTQALKGDSKMQGDWGEMILEKTLEDCGLIQDQQYFLQQNFKDKDGNNFRPDAVIAFPNNERAVIDAKVSLTAYQAAIKEEDATLRERYMKEHVTSIKKHVDELSDKNYEKLVPGCIGYVLMFIPYESGYSAALKTDPSILQYAYRKHIIILSPSNLLMALQLTHTMWQNFRMTKNVEEILYQSNELFDKFVTFAETFVKIGTNIERLQQDFNKAKGQLNEGKGNIVRRLEGLKTLGINPKKQIPENL